MTWWDSCIRAYRRLAERISPIIERAIHYMTVHFWGTVTVLAFLLSFLLYEITGWLPFGICLFISALFLLRLVLLYNADNKTAQRIMGIRKQVKKQQQPDVGMYVVMHVYADEADPEAGGDQTKEVEQIEMDNTTDFAEQIPIRLRPDYPYVHQYIMWGQEPLYVAGYQNNQYDEIAARRRGD